MHRVREAQVARVAPVEVAGLAEDRLRAGVVPRRHRSGSRTRRRRRSSRPPARQRARLLADVVLGVRAAVGAEREQLHHLARVVLVRRALLVLDPVQPDEHRRVGVTSRSRSWNEPSACGGRARSAGASASGCRRRRSRSRTSRARSSVMRSTSGRLVRTIRSSHHAWSWPQASSGASGCPFVVVRLRPDEPLAARVASASARRRRAPSSRALRASPGAARSRRARAGARPAARRTGLGRRAAATRPGRWSVLSRSARIPRSGEATTRSRPAARSAPIRETRSPGRATARWRA